MCLEMVPNYFLTSNLVVRDRTESVFVFQELGTFSKKACFKLHGDVGGSPKVRDKGGASGHGNVVEKALGKGSEEVAQQSSNWDNNVMGKDLGKGSDEVAQQSSNWDNMRVFVNREPSLSTSEEEVNVEDPVGVSPSCKGKEVMVEESESPLSTGQEQVNLDLAVVEHH
ncbi:hypothetical protein Fmac_001413 [Flemingia macrophylla]|uniref:Uncharacterized protein n=1 Tax=Flemingia macrophylla TaxID=520843 RepID=A0ABD1NH04_9FABA